VNPPIRLPAAAPRRVRDRLARAADGPVRVLHRSPHAVYLDLDGWCVGIVDADAAQVPCALRVLDLDGVTGGRVEVRAGVLHLDATPVWIGRIVDVSLPALAPSPGCSPVEARVPDAQQWVGSLVGAGDGLTPYGDDVLCGWLAIHRAAGVATPTVDAAVRSLSHRTTLLSATLLDCALHGEVLPQFATWVAALGTTAEPAAATALEAVGHTSGRGLLAGARQGLTGLTGSVAA
jgi:hypothetical protein